MSYCIEMYRNVIDAMVIKIRFDDRLALVEYLHERYGYSCYDIAHLLRCYLNNVHGE